MLTLVLILLSILIIVVSGTRFKLHPFLGLLIAAAFFGISSGLAPMKVIDLLNQGFGETIGKIGILIIFGLIIGTFLENSGGAYTLASKVLQMVGQKRVHTAMAFIGYIVSIPVFADSGFIILSSLNRALTKKSGQSLAGTAIALSLGLTATHTMVPPTPGPIVAAGMIGADLGRVIILGLIVSFLALSVTIFYARWTGRKIFIDPVPKTENIHPESEHIKIPGPLKSFLPIFVPIVLIVLRSISEYPTHPFGTEALSHMIGFIGNPVMAMFVGVIIALSLPEKLEREMLSTTGWTGEALKSAAIIILVTGAGGAFGKVLQSSDLEKLMNTSFFSSGWGIWLPFLVAATIKTAQGSSTVAIITTATFIAPLLHNLSLDSETSKAMVVIAIGAGSAVVSHANDSFFWVVTQLSDMNVKQGYRIQSLGTGLLGLSAMIFLSIINMIVS